MGRVGGLLVAVVLLLGGGCAASPAEPAPKFTVRGAGEPLVLPAWTFCNDNMCADGRPPETPADVGAVDEVRIGFSERDWTVTAEFETVGEDCGRTYAVPLTRGSDGEWTLGPAGPAGTYDVTLGANGNPYGDAVATFRWTTRARGVMPEPRAQLLTGYFEMHVSNLATTPERAALTVTATSAGGKTTTIQPEVTRPEVAEGPTCAAPGRVDFSVPHSVDKPDLGLPPLRYDVRLTLDGTEHRASARVPQDAKDDGHVYVDLAFEPPLPPFTG